MSTLIKKLKIKIICGGWSNERRISLLSGRNIYNCLKLNKFNVVFFDLKKNNLNKIFQDKPDLIFNALHGEFGEDGNLSHLAYKYNTLITHSDDLTSALCFNKRLLKSYLKKTLNVSSPREIVNYKHISFPLILKPTRGGSSNGVKLINNLNEYKRIKLKKEIMIEEAIFGKELTVTVLDDRKKILPLGVTEIEHDQKIYDYEAKYTKGKSIHYLPGRISKKKYKHLLDLSGEIYKKCNCKSIARLDFILSEKKDQFYFLELNTHPGMTEISLAPEQAKFNNLSYYNLIKKIIISSL